MKNLHQYGKFHSEDNIVRQNALNVVCPLSSLTIFRKNIKVAKELKKIAILFDENFSICF